MNAAADQLRPEATPWMSRAEFERWYWPVSELQSLCSTLGVSKAGSKAELRARAAAALAGETLPAPRRKKRKTKWSAIRLTRETVITEDISFGPAVRGFFKQEIGPSFVCHSDFMDWMRQNSGATFDDAIAAWHMLDERKLDPDFRREIASCNNYLQYLRDIRDAHPELSLDQAKQCWDAKKIRPAMNGFVIYEPGDLCFLDP